MWREGYPALEAQRARRRAGGPDAYAVRLLGRRAVVARGHDGAKLFYDPSVIERRKAVPAALADLLFGHGAVHGLDGESHQRRKAMFLDVLGEESVTGLAHRIGESLRGRLAMLRGRRVVVFDELVEAYGVAVLSWAGVECPPQEARRVSGRLARIVDGFGAAGLAYPRGWIERLRCDAWARRIIAQVRAGTRVPAPRTPLRRIAAAGELDLRLAAVELLNILRPTVAVAWPASFAVLALWQHPQWRELLRDDGEADVDERRVAFGHEVRRFYPFVPALASRVQRPAELGGMRLNVGDRMVLDVVGTDHDPALWEEPDEFRPERFLGLEPDPYDFVPQGGGDPRTGHRCPGEPLTVRILAETLGALAGVDYDVLSPPTYDPARIPTRPDGGLVVRVR